MDFSLSSEIEDFRRRVALFVAEKILPVEADRSQWDAHENISDAALARLRAEAKKAELWAPQMPKARGGRARPSFRPPSFQPVERDFAFVVAADVAAEAVLRAARNADKVLIADAQMFDVYQGAGIEEGKKSVALSITLQPAERTLTDAEIEAVAETIVKAVAAATGAVLRQ